MMSVKNLNHRIAKNNKKLNNKLTIYRNAKLVFDDNSKGIQIEKSESDCDDTYTIINKKKGNVLIQKMREIAPELETNQRMLSREQINKLIKVGKIRNDTYYDDSPNGLDSTKQYLEDKDNQYFQLVTNNDDPYWKYSNGVGAIPMIINNPNDVDYTNSNIILDYTADFNQLKFDIGKLKSSNSKLELQKSLLQKHHFDNHYKEYLANQKSANLVKIKNLENKNKRLDYISNLIK